MRDFFIKGLEIVISVVIVLAAVGIVVAAIGALMGSVPTAPGLPPIEGPLAAAVILIGGALTLLITGGALYLFLGIYANTRRTADALELLITLRR
ncbi:hypothetical protein [Jannaschia sp. M317]|uniref:hypothetical protein n=1 Tax=Jannaschia sp. M317 TaxID=2867011 RepID=UPI0021A65809|nr:hypothetical protein [Jannaschia sp. M317]UWQ19158.1 hypothetical protein K3551_07770 [Jannaschia sp. M317]